MHTRPVNENLGRETSGQRFRRGQETCAEHECFGFVSDLGFRNSDFKGEALA